MADAKNDILTGGLIALGCIACAIFLVVVPSREGASPGSKIFLIGLAVSGIGKGLSMALQAKRRLEEAKKEPIQPPQTTTGSSAPDRV